MNAYPNLFRPGRLGNRMTRNRIVMSPMDENMANADGSVSDQTIAYYEERAKGGAAVIITGAVSVDYPRGKAVSSQERLDGRKYVKNWERLARAVHRYGALLIPQIHHAGANTDPEITDGVTPFKISDVGPEGYVEMTKADIHMLQQKYIAAARYAQDAGCDGVEVHGYLMMQFITSYINNRKDEYGGSLENRSRFVREIISGIREACGPAFIIGTKIQVHNFDTDSLSDEDSLELAKMYEAAGCNYLHAVPGISPKTTDLIESASYRQGGRVVLAERIKKVVNIPVIAVGMLREPAFCEKVLAEGRADFVALGRALLADPYWPEKARTGKSCEIRKCISCLDACYGNILLGRPIRCVLNPRTGCEEELKYEKAPAAKRNVVVIGGGIAGMQAAVTAAERGHQVTLVEATDRLGGQLNLACVPPHKEKIIWPAEWFAEEVQRKGVKVIMNTKATTELVMSLKPDEVIAATGARPWAPPIPGMENGVPAWRILDGSMELPENKDVTVIGAGSIGCETALYLAERGNRITILELLPDFAAGLEIDNKLELKEDMDKAGIRLILKAKVRSIGNNYVEYEDENGATVRVTNGLLVLSMGQRPYGGELVEALQEAGLCVTVIGDAFKTGKIVDATTSGFYAAMNIR